MSSTNFNALAVVTVVLIVVAIFMGLQTNTTELGFVRGQELIGFLDTDKMNRIELVKGEDKVVAVRRGNQFLVENRSMYPADNGRINDLIKKCQDVKCMRKVSESADTHAELGVDDGNKEATIIKFMADDKVLTGLIIGKEADKGEYVRKFGSNEVFTSESKQFLSAETLEYVDRTICKVDRERVQQVELTGNGQPVVIKKDKDGNAILEGIPENMVARTGVPEQVLNQLSQLSFTDFKSEADFKDLDFKFKYVLRTDSHERYVFKIAKKDDKYYATTSAKYTGPKSLTKAEVDKGKDDPKIQKLNEAILQAADKVMAYNARHQSWVYELDKWPAENMTKAFADMIEEEKEFLKIEEKALKSVTVVPFGGKTYTIESPKEGEVNLVGIPEGKKAKGFDHQLVFTAGKNLRWDEHRKPDHEDVKDLEFKAKYTAHLRDGTQYVFDLAKGKGEGKEMDRWVKVSAAYGGPAEGEAAVLAKAAVAKFNGRHQERVYKVSSVEQMVRKFSDLVQPAEALPEEIRASHILLAFNGAERSTATRTKEEAKKLAEDLHQQLLAEPGKFEDLAKANSDCSSKPKGGDLGRFKADSMAKEFSDAAFKLKVGEMSGVVESPFGFHIIKRTE